MRFERLSLACFGHFEALDLEFGDGPGLVVIHGVNEAGKTTVLRSIHSLFFGIDERTPYAFRFPYQSMAIHAELRDSAGQRLSLTRRKRRKDALTGNIHADPGAFPCDETRLRAYFGGVDENLYRAVFGFTHTDLQQGAEVLRVAELGELLGGGALAGGAEVVRKVLGSLRGEADALYKARGKNPPMNLLLAQLQDVRNRLRDATFSQARYHELTQATKTARDTRHAAEAELGRLRQRSSRLETLLRAFEDYHGHQRLLARLAEPGLATRLRRAEAEQVQPLLAELTRLTDRERELSAELARLEQRVRQAVAPPAVLAEAATIERLLRRSDPISMLRRTLPGECERLERERAAISAEFQRWTLRGPAEASGLSHEALTPIYPLLTRWRQAQQELALAQRVKAEESAELAAVSAELRAIEAELGSEDPVVTAELEQLQQLGSEVEHAEDELQRLATEQELALVRLHPRPEATALERLRLPSVPAVQAMHSRRQDIERDVQAVQATQAEQRSEVVRLQAELAVLAAHEDLPDPSTLAELRRRRDQLWGALRQQLLRKASVDQVDLFGGAEAPPNSVQVQGSPQVAAVSPRSRGGRGEMRAFEAALADADALADRLWAAADQVARATALRRALELAHATIEATSERLQQLEATRAAWTAEWTALWEDITPGAPEEMLAWRIDAAALRDLAATRMRQQHKLDRLRPQLAAVEDRLRAGLGPEATGITRMQLLLRLRERDRQHQAHRGRRTALQSRRSALEAALARNLTGQDLHRATLEASEGELRGKFRQFGLPEDIELETARETLEALANLSERSHRSREAWQSYQQKRADLDEFDAAVASLVERLGSELPEAADDSEIEQTPEQRLEQISQALERYRAAMSTHELAQEAWQTRERERASVVVMLERARGELARLRDSAGATTDHELLQQSQVALERAEVVRQTGELDLRLARLLGDGEQREAYAAELQATRREVLLEDQRQLSSRISELERQLLTAAQQEGRYDNEAQQLGGDRAARLSAEFEVLRSDLEDQVERYVLVHLADRVLDRVTDRYAREHQPALLHYTSELLARITGGKHQRVVIQPEARSLAVVDHGGRLRLPSELSSGTCEQLFLALRLAYILDHCDHNEPLPLVLDDVLVNFDDRRAAASLAALQEVGRTTQVVLLTCHGRSVELARGLGDGVRIRELPGSAQAAAV